MIHYKGNRTVLIVVLMAVSILLVLSACSKNPTSPEGTAKVEPGVDLTAPAELIVFTTITSLTQEAFDENIAKPVKAKFPQYTLKYIPTVGSVTLQSLIVSGIKPDIIWDSASGMKTTLINFNLQYDMMELVKKYKYDLERFDSSTIQSMKNMSGEGRLYGLPNDINGTAMFYNKDIFDRFGVSYPKDGLTWDDTYELARKLTRTDNSIMYKGLGMFYSYTLVNNQLSLLSIDPKEDRAIVNNDKWKQLFDTYKRFYEIPGNNIDTVFTNFNGQLTSFHKNRNVALMIAPVSAVGRFAAETNFNWDMVAVPTFKELPKVGFQAAPRYYFVTNGKNKEQAFQVVTQLLSDEVQMKDNREGRATSLKSEAIRKTFGQEGDTFKNRNAGAVFYHQFAPTLAPNPNTINVSTAAIHTEFLKVIEGKQDVNTALRLADDAINKLIADEKAK